MNAKGFITTAAAGAALTAFAPSAAQAQPATPGTCQFSAHVQLTNGSYSSDASDAECAGWIGDQLVHGGGYLDAWGTYSVSGCVTRWRDNFFYAEIPHAIEFFGPSYVQSEGGYQLSPTGPAMTLAGSGDSNGMPFREDGVVQFTPDQAGCAVRSGTLKETVVLVDGGSGNPAAAAAINRRAGGDGSNEASDGGQTAAVAPHAKRHHAASRRHHHSHRRGHKSRTMRAHRR